MADQVKFNPPWNVAAIEAQLNDCAAAKGESASLTDALAAKADASDTYTKTETDTAITTAIHDLAAPPTGGTLKYIESINEENGVIRPTAQSLATSVTNSTAPVTSYAVKIAVDKKADKTTVAQIINLNRKNLMPFDLDAMKQYNVSAGYSWNGNVCTISDGATLNLTATVDTDNGTITIAGSKPATSSGLLFRIVPAEKAFDLPLDGYILSGCPVGGSSTTYQMRALINNSATFAQDNGSGASFTLNVKTIERVEIVLGTSALNNVNLVFKPMIDTRLIHTLDSTYEPYAPSNMELWKMIKALQGGTS